VSSFEFIFDVVSELPEWYKMGFLGYLLLGSKRIYRIVHVTSLKCRWIKTSTFL